MNNFVLNIFCMLPLSLHLHWFAKFLCPFVQAYHFSRIRKIVGVEINSDLSELQQEMIERHNMSDRVEVLNY